MSSTVVKTELSGDERRLKTIDVKVRTWRNTIAGYHRTLRSKQRLSTDDLNELGRIIAHSEKLGEEAKPYLDKWGFPKVFDFLVHRTDPGSVPGPFIVRIETLLDLWETFGDQPADEVNVPFNDAVKLEDKDGDAAAPAISLSSWAMRGIVGKKGINGKISYSIQDDYPERKSASEFGHNGLKVGDWWPLQICTIRDGAHGSRVGGIYGKSQEGAYSIVLSGSGDYRDVDMGDSIVYTGSGEKGEDQVLGAGNQALILSCDTTKKPVRVLRGFRMKESPYRPTSGLRYDGLYMVTRWWRERGPDGYLDYKFSLEREPNQDPIRVDVPGPAEKETLQG
jgi:SAD/SRA domain